VTDHVLQWGTLPVYSDFGGINYGIQRYSKMNWIIYILIFNAGGILGFFVAAMLAASSRADERTAALLADASREDAGRAPI
jgi:hypothetical protein